MKSPGTLSLEQEFQLTVLKEQVENLAPTQAQEYLLEAIRQLMMKDNWIKHTFKECYLKL